jgi:hypothetical protein
MTTDEAVPEAAPRPQPPRMPPSAAGTLFREGEQKRLYIRGVILPEKRISPGWRNHDPLLCDPLPEPLVNSGSYPRTRCFFLRAPSADGAIQAALADNPQWRVIGIEPRDSFARPLQSDPAFPTPYDWYAAKPRLARQRARHADRSYPPVQYLRAAATARPPWDVYAARLARYAPCFSLVLEIFLEFPEACRHLLIAWCRLRSALFRTGRIGSVSGMHFAGTDFPWTICTMSLLFHHPAPAIIICRGIWQLCLQSCPEHHTVHKRRTDVAFKLIRRCSCLTHLCLNILFDKAPQVQCWSPTWPQLLRRSCD